MPILGVTPHDPTAPPLPPPPPVQSAPRVVAFVLHGQIETTPHSVVAPASIVDDTQARIDTIEQRIKSLHVYDGVIGWDGYDDLPMATLPVEFRMLDIESYTRIGCPVFTYSCIALLCVGIYWMRHR